VEHLNQAIARVLRGQRVRPHENYAGRPILITHNDYGSSLFNGDVGVLCAEKRSGPLYACFRTGADSVRRVALGRLPAHESVYAMTVHKSQGSEFERVALVLPEPSSPVLTRELLYTAITRAKSSLSVYGSEAAVRAAIGRHARRSSGLSARLG
jgi:exodeoxyribonuclease V alpha subunit